MAKEPKSDVWGEAPDDDDPNKDNGAEVENREDDDVAADGVAKSEDPLPDEADGTVDDCGAVDVPGVAELAKRPAT